MAPSLSSKRNLIRPVKRTVTILTTVVFLAATAFLAVGLWLPANAAPSTSATDVQASLLALDKPHAPLPKLRLPQPSISADEEGEMMAAIVNRDLATELNDWTYTQSAFTDIINGFDSLFRITFSLQTTLVRNEIYFWTGILQNAGLNSLAQQYVAALLDLGLALNALFATGPISPHS